MRPRANAAPASILPPIAPTNKETPAAGRAVPSATPATAAAATATKNMDGAKVMRTPSRLWAFGLWTLDFARFGFFNQPQGGIMKVAQLRFARFVFGEFYKVAAFQKFNELFLLLRRQQVRVLQFVQKFLGRAFRRAEIEPLFEVNTDRVRNQDAKRFRLRDEFERLCQPLLCADVRWNRRFRWDLQPPFLPPTPHREQQRRHRQHAKCPPKPFPAARNVHRRLDVADVVGD